MLPKLLPGLSAQAGNESGRFLKHRKRGVAMRGISPGTPRGQCQWSSMAQHVERAKSESMIHASYQSAFYNPMPRWKKYRRAVGMISLHTNWYQNEPGDPHNHESNDAIWSSRPSERSTLHGTGITWKPWRSRCQGFIPHVQTRIPRTFHSGRCDRTSQVVFAPGSPLTPWSAQSCSNREPSCRVHSSRKHVAPQMSCVVAFLWTTHSTGGDRVAVPTAALGFAFSAFACAYVMTQRPQHPTPHPTRSPLDESERISDSRHATTRPSPGTMGRDPYQPTFFHTQKSSENDTTTCRLVEHRARRSKRYDRGAHMISVCNRSHPRDTQQDASGSPMAPHAHSRNADRSLS